MTGPLEEDDALAAEYALGTLDGPERAEAEARRARDVHFNKAVLDWERLLAPLAEAGEDMRAPLDLRGRVLSRIATLGKSEPVVAGSSSVLRLRRELRLWRGATGLAAALAAVLGLWIARQDFAPPSERQTFVAVLQQGTSASSFVVSLDVSRRTLTVIPAAASEPAGKSFELWMIDPERPKPVSMGVVDARAPVHPLMPQTDAAAMSRATYAVTVEPPGGSPTGQPSSAPVYIGKFLSTSL